MVGEQPDRPKPNPLYHGSGFGKGRWSGQYECVYWERKNPHDLDEQPIFRVAADLGVNQWVTFLKVKNIHYAGFIADLVILRYGLWLYHPLNNVPEEKCPELEQLRRDPKFVTFENAANVFREQATQERAAGEADGTVERAKKAYVDARGEVARSRGQPGIDDLKNKLRDELFEQGFLRFRHPPAASQVS